MLTFLLMPMTGASTLDAPTAFPLLTPSPRADDVSFCLPSWPDATPRRLAAVVYVRTGLSYSRRDLIPVVAKNDPDCPGTSGAVSLRAVRGDSNPSDSF